MTKQELVQFLNEHYADSTEIVFYDVEAAEICQLTSIIKMYTSDGRDAAALLGSIQKS